MRWQRYTVRLRHDRGHITIATVSHCARAAVSLVLGFERAPVRAVVTVKDARGRSISRRQWKDAD